MANPAFLSAGGETGAAMRVKDWSRTPLGPPENWPELLRSMIRVVLTARQPMFLIWDRDHQSLLYNDAYGILLGDRHPDALGRSFTDVWGEARERLGELVTTAFNGQALYSEDILLMLDRGHGIEECHFAYSYTPIYDADDIAQGLFCACSETTKAVSEHEAVERERRSLNEMFDQAPGFMCLLEGPEHRFMLSNLAHRRLIDGRCVIGLTVAEALPDAEAQGYVALLDQVYKTGQVFRGMEMTYRVQLAPGAPVHERVMDFVYQPLTNARGEVTGIFAEGADVTERAQAEAELRKSERELRIALDAGGFGTWTHDFTSEVLSTSPIYRSMFGNDPHLPLSYNDVLARIHPQDIERRQAVIDLSRSSRSDYHVEYRIFTPRGDLRWVSVWGQWIYGADDRPLFLSGVSADITERKKLEEQLLSLNRDLERRVDQRTAELKAAEATLRQTQKMEAVGQLTGGIAHDFNNMLMGVSGSLELIGETLDQGRLEDARQYIAAAQASAQRAASLTQRLLAFSRRQTLDPKPTAVATLILGLEDLIRRTVGPSIEVRVLREEGLWWTQIDSSQLENALLNLVINARDAMPDGGRVIITTSNLSLDAAAAQARQLPPGDYVSVSVSDTGLGMTPEVIERAFDPFFTTKPMGQGTGLGLSMIHGFVGQSGGQVHIDSEPGRGATVCLDLPRCAGEVSREARAPARSAVAGSADGESILLVDDEVIVLMLMRNVLKTAGYRVMEASDGHSALKILQSDVHIDLLVSDVGLPGGMNGRQVADAARLTRPGLKALFVTGYAENDAVGAGKLEPGMQVLTKPFVVSALTAKVREMIADR